MKPRKPKDLMKTLEKKGFIKESSNKKTHHIFYYFVHNNKKTHINTYFSHGSKDYDKFLMSMIKRQLKFTDSNDCELFFDCTFTKENYEVMLIEKKIIS